MFMLVFLPFIHYLCYIKPTVMKHLLISLAILCSALTASATQYAVFNLNSFDGWIYTREGVTLNTEYIGANKVKLFRNSAGKDFTLISPSFEPTSNRNIRVKFDWQSPTLGEDNYNLTKNSPFVELLDLNGNVLQQVFYQLKTEELKRILNVVLNVPEGYSGAVKVRLAAWNADVNTPGAVREVEIFAPTSGDVNGDGAMNVSDVTQLINVILGISEMPEELADVNGDGTVNVTDVTTLINAILGVITL